MSDMPLSDSHLSIGEVLDLLKGDHPDVTISKIRFLESQGLINPERTPSGYRKFYEHDVKRLRWVLLQQRDNFLPLKIIKDRLDTAGEDLDATGQVIASKASAFTKVPASIEDESTVVKTPERKADVEQVKPAAEVASMLGPLLGSLTSATFSLDELSNASGQSREQIRELERYGIVTGRAVGGHVIYDEEALVAARLSRELADHGVEARHLRMYKTAAEREAGFYEQMVLPLIKQRNPASRRQAIDKAGDLARLGESLRASLLRQGLKSVIEGSDPSR